MKTNITYILLSILCLSGVTYAESNLPMNGWVPKEIKPIKKEFPGGFIVSVGSKIVLANGLTLKSDLVRAKYIGLLLNGKSAPYFIFQANTCEACDEAPMIRIVSQVDSSLNDATAEPLPFPPGRLFAFGPEQKILSQSRMFYGDCLKGHNQTAVWFIRSFQTTDKWIDSVFTVEVLNGKLKTKTLTSSLPNISEPIEKVNSGTCYEVPGSDVSEGP